ncbi:neuropeptide F receptor-like isoform X2 [Macrosteles quadrilineatus]|uniref:neuropeptide F receptor-like isoform X1 n=1 Tax=Macrosteles quadrilineatus TaxID=74068 RepID=UPI0023E0CC88|nr:neuropeptide F receptor-like isoform X1 [Macrosteles quadrilineatus]XP_054262501.1 neuropeptide F receptor-like isoform X2 [Macrosteles quadrilineatus]
MNNDRSSQMLCEIRGISSIKTCLSMQLNGTFNFSLDEAIGILIEHQRRNRNVGQVTEYVLIVVYSFLILLGLFANLVVSFVVARRPQMHTARNLFIVNLTLSDMTLCVICMPFTLLKIIRRQWDMGELLCKLVPVLQGTNILVSVGTITVIALDRYFTIVHTHNGTDRARVVCSIVCVWLLSLGATLPIFFYQVVEPFKFQEVVLYEMCIESWPSQELKLLYSVCILLIQAVIPALVVVVVHARISSHLHAHAKTQRDSRRAQRELARNKRTTVLLSVVAVLFAVSWTPLGVFSLASEVISPPDSSQSLYVTLAVCHVIYKLSIHTI